MSRQQRLPDALRRTTALILTWALVLLPLLSRLDPAAAAALGLPGILCAQAGAPPSGPTPATHDDCALTCALAQVQILAAAEPGLTIRRDAVLAAKPGELRLSAIPGEVLAELRIRGPPAVPVA